MDYWKKQKADAIANFISTTGREVSSADINRRFKTISIPTIRKVLVDLQDSGRVQARLKGSGRKKYLNDKSIAIYQPDVYWTPSGTKTISNDFNH